MQNKQDRISRTKHVGKRMQRAHTAHINNNGHIVHLNPYVCMMQSICQKRFKVMIVRENCSVSLGSVALPPLSQCIFPKKTNSNSAKHTLITRNSSAWSHLTTSHVFIVKDFHVWNIEITTLIPYDCGKLNLIFRFHVSVQ